ncbi:unnamed protein product [Diplocarpon coronariae]|nr:hypothetical protein JHW43_007951 [Diplocarpon mali]
MARTKGRGQERQLPCIENRWSGQARGSDGWLGKDGRPTEPGGDAIQDSTVRGDQTGRTTGRDVLSTCAPTLLVNKSRGITHHDRTAVHGVAWPRLALHPIILRAAPACRAAQLCLTCLPDPDADGSALAEARRISPRPS